MRALLTTRRVTRDECPWLETDVEADELVYPFKGHTYGCVGDGIAVSRRAGEYPFFELPLDSVQWVAIEE